MADAESISAETSTENQDDPLQDLSAEQIYQLLQDTIRANEVLQTETEMFDKYLKRIDPGKEGAPAGQLGLGQTPAPSSQDLLAVRMSRKKSKSRSSTSERQMKLSAEQKCDIAQREIEEYRTEIEKIRQESEKVLDNYKAVMEEAEVRYQELTKADYEFERDIVRGACIPRTSKVMAEKAQRFMDEKVKSKDTLVEKLRLKNASLKVQKKKLQMQLRQKEEMGEVLHEVDFNQLKIENQQYIEKIDERNQDLLRLKLMAGNTQQVLNNYKKRLASLTKEAHSLRSEIHARKEMQVKLDSETSIVEEERAQAEKVNRKLHKQIAEYKVPPVMDYVFEKADLYDLQKKVKSWERKLEIAEMALAACKKEWKHMKFVSTEPHSMAWQTVPAM